MNYDTPAGDNYFRLWSRYHVYGIGILYGWLLFELRQGSKVGKFIKSGAVSIVFMIIFIYKILTSTISSKPFVSSRDDPTLDNLNFTLIFANILYDILFFN